MPDAETVLHEFDHPLDLVGESLVELGHGGCLALQHRIAELDDLRQGGLASPEGFLVISPNRLFATFGFDLDFDLGRFGRKGLFRPRHSFGVGGRFFAQGRCFFLGSHRRRVYGLVNRDRRTSGPDTPCLRSAFSPTCERISRADPSPEQGNPFPVTGSSLPPMDENQEP